MSLRLLLGIGLTILAFAAPWLIAWWAMWSAGRALTAYDKAREEDDRS